MSDNNRYKKINLRNLYPDIYQDEMQSDPEIELPEEQAELILIAVADYSSNEEKHARRLRSSRTVDFERDYPDVHNLLQTQKVHAIIENKLAMQRMKKQFSELSPKQRRRFMLYASGYTDSEIAKREHTSRQNINKSISAARLKLRLKMKSM